MNDEIKPAIECPESPTGYHCTCYSFSEPCCYCDKLAGEVKESE